MSACGQWGLPGDFFWGCARPAEQTFWDFCIEIRANIYKLPFLEIVYMHFDLLITFLKKKYIRKANFENRIYVNRLFQKKFPYHIYTIFEINDLCIRYGLKLCPKSQKPYIRFLKTAYRIYWIFRHSRNFFKNYIQNLAFENRIYFSRARERT